MGGAGGGLRSGVSGLGGCLVEEHVGQFVGLAGGEHAVWGLVVEGRFDEAAAGVVGGDPDDGWEQAALALFDAGVVVA